MVEGGGETGGAPEEWAGVFVQWVQGDVVDGYEDEGEEGLAIVFSVVSWLNSSRAGKNSEVSYLTQMTKYNESKNP